MIDESLERELFALRAETMATPRLDLSDVLARAHRPQPTHFFGCARLAAFASAVACAAASWLAVPAPSSHDGDTTASMSYFDGLSCRADMPDVVSSSEPAMCVAKAQLVCDVTLESSAP